MFSFELHSSAQVCDATGDDSSNAGRLIKNILLLTILIKKIFIQ